uniref:DDE_3 domain-containing protein n=1 Tax=Anopheles atroparvus TaxID=41427 RepID=A0A182JGZ6_ANOAO
MREDLGVNVSHTTIAKLIRGFNYSFKSIYSKPEPRDTLEDNIELRYEYADKFSKISMAQMGEGGAVFVDEVAFTLTMRCSRGSAFQGSGTANECELKNNHLKKRYISIACAMNRNGIVHLSTQTKAFKQKLFLDFIEELKDKLSSQNVTHAVIIMDDSVETNN